MRDSNGKTWTTDAQNMFLEAQPIDEKRKIACSNKLKKTLLLLVGESFGEKY
ncbi:hypothetical protein P4S72_13240 [Vibrio sp. PP-XX7]